MARSGPLGPTPSDRRRGRRTSKSRRCRRCAVTLGTRQATKRRRILVLAPTPDLRFTPRDWLRSRPGNPVRALDESLGVRPAAVDRFGDERPGEAEIAEELSRPEALGRHRPERPVAA